MKIINFIFPMLIAILCVSISPALTAQNDTLFISEIHYDNVSIDTLEALELTGSAGMDLTDYSVILYNGSTGDTYNTIDLSAYTIANQSNGFGTIVISFPKNGIQNGDPDGMAVVDALDNLLEFISYEGVFYGNNGPAEDSLSSNIGVTQSNTSTDIGSSMELIAVADGNWAWQSDDDGTNTFGLLNSGVAAALPIELIDFSAKSNQSSVELNWSTASELNNDYMEIERAIYGLQFEALGRVKGAGTTSVDNHYELTDENPFEGVNYYRLKQVDFDGTVTYWNTISVEFGDAHKQFVIYPNPVKQGDQLTIVGEITPGTKIELVDQTGRVVLEQIIYRSEDRVFLNLSSVQAGLYAVRFIQGQHVQVQKLILN